MCLHPDAIIGKVTEMKRLFVLVPVMTMFAVPAMAQTILTLSASGSAQGEPDEAVAHFEMQATKPDAASAQAVVNAAIAKALAEARAVPGVVVTTGSYNTYTTTYDPKGQDQSTAQQSLTLTQQAANGVPDKAFTTLLGKLQADGLMLTGLDGQLSKAGRQQVQKLALQDAISNLRAQAGDIASALHKQVGALQTLTVDTSNNSVPRFQPRMFAAASAPMSAPPPESAPAEITVNTTVNAKIALDPAP